MDMKIWLPTTVSVTTNSEEMYGGSMVTCIPRILKNMKNKNVKREIRLDNGLKCVLLNSEEKKFSHKVTLALTIKCGSLKSEKGKKETAHLLEHIQMNFDKQKKNSERYFYAKASTNFFSTTYYISCFDNDLNFCLNLLKEVYLKNRITIENRKEALREVFAESNVRYNDNRRILLKNTYLFKDSIFEEHLPNADIEKALNITLKDLNEFHNKWHSCANSQLVMVFSDFNNDFFHYEELVNKTLGKIKGKVTEDQENDIRKIDICNDKTYSILDVCNTNPMLCFVEIKQHKDYIREKVEKGLFFQYIHALLDEFFSIQNLKYKINIRQFENHSFIFIFEFSQIVDDKEIISKMCKFLLDNLSMLKTNILIMKNEIIEPMVTGHEFLEYIIHYFVYKQTLNYNSTHEMEEDVIKVFNDFDISSVFKIIKELEVAKCKSFIFGKRNDYE